MPQSSAELAKQFGGARVADLAAQFGGKVVDDAPAPAAPPSTQRASVLADAVTGPMKSVAEGVINLGQAAYNIVPGLAKVSDFAQQAMFGNVVPGNQLFAAARQDTAPTSTGESVAKLVTDIGAAFVPGGAISRTAKAASALAPRGAQVLTRAAVEAAGAGGTAVAQGNDPTLATALGGTLGAASGAASKIASKLKGSADDSMLAALGPAGRGTGPVGTNQVELGKKVAPELLKRRFSASSHEAALAKVGDAIEAADARIDTAMKGISPPGTTVKLKTGPIMAALAKAKDAGQVAGVDVGTGKIANAVIDDVIADLKQIGPTMTPDQAVKFRQKIGPLAKWSQLATNADNVKADAYKDVYNGIRGAIEKLGPDIRSANKEMSFWLNVRDLLERSSRRPQPPSSGTSGAVLGGIATAGTGVTGTLAAAAVGRQLQRLVRSPGWRFMSANVKDRMAETIAKGDLGAFNQIVASSVSSGASAAGGQ